MDDFVPWDARTLLNRPKFTTSQAKTKHPATTERIRYLAITSEAPALASSSACERCTLNQSTSGPSGIFRPRPNLHIRRQVELGTRGGVVLGVWSRLGLAVLGSCSPFGYKTELFIEFSRSTKGEQKQNMPSLRWRVKRLPEMENLFSTLSEN